MQGRIMIYSGRVPAGLALLDEAMVGISAGEVSPIIAGMVYCSMIEACQEVSDFSRAASWTSALTRWCEAQPGLVPYTGQCSLHRGQIMRLRGAYDEALAEYVLAQRRCELEGTTAPAALALTEQGDVLRIRGKLDEADAAYRKAAGFGFEPQPGLALSVACSRSDHGGHLGDPPAARRGRGPVQRSRMLPAAVEILVTADFLTRPAGMRTSFPRSRRRSATPRFGRWRRTRQGQGRAGLWGDREHSAMAVNRVASGARSGRRTRLAGRGCWSRVPYASSVMRIRQQPNWRLPATALPNWVRCRESRRSTSCWDERGPAASPNVKLRS